MSTWLHFIKVCFDCRALSTTMKYFSLITFSLSVVCLNLISSCYGNDFVLECKLTSPSGIQIFRRDTEDMLEKVYDIKRCGTKHLVDKSFPDSDAFANCIAELNLPKSYENKFSFPMKLNFINKIHFKNAVQSAADSVCTDLKFKYDFGSNFNFNNDSEVVTVFGGNQRSNIDGKTSVDSNENLKSPFFYTAIIFGALLLVLFAAIVIHLLFKHKKEKSLENNVVERDSDIISSATSSSNSYNNDLPAYEPPSYKAYTDVKN